MDDNNESVETPLLSGNNEVTIKLYKKRWVIIAVFVAYAALNAAQWCEYTIISTATQKFYNVSSSEVVWTSAVYMAVFPPLFIPASYIIDRMGLRVAALIGGLGTAIGTIIKIFSVEQELFWIALLAQLILGIAQTVILSLPPRLASVWYGSHEVSTACGIGIFGSQLGNAIGFLLPGLIVSRDHDVKIIGNEFRTLNWIFAGSAIPIIIAVLFYFPARPRIPPSVTQINERSQSREFSSSAFFASFVGVLKKNGFVLHVIAYGINVGAISTIGALLDQYVTSYFPDETGSGVIGVFGVVLGMLGVVLVGLYLDKTRNFKDTCVVTYSFCSIGVSSTIIALAFRNKVTTVALFGITGSGAYWTSGFEKAIELTYPSSEIAATGLMAASGQLIGVLATIMAGYLLQHCGPFWSLTSQAVLLLIGTIITVATPDVLNRQEAFRRSEKRASIQEQ